MTIAEVVWEITNCLAKEWKLNSVMFYYNYQKKKKKKKKKNSHASVKSAMYQIYTSTFLENTPCFS